MMRWAIRLRGELTRHQRIILMLGGLFFLLLLWVVMTSGDNSILPPNIFPSPTRVLYAFRDLYVENQVVKHAGRSIGLNLGGYVKAILYAVPIGFALGLIPLFRGAFQSIVDSIRFLPLTALTMMFVVWYGIASESKINFLAFGIFIYLLPIIIQRIDEVEDVYLKTVRTLGATSWQTIRTVYLPSVLSRLSDDIRILTAISWTYIIVAENVADQGEGGLGSLIYKTGQRMGRVDKTFACLIIIMLIGICQDKLFMYLDKKFFPYKYLTKDNKKSNQSKGWRSYFDLVVSYFSTLLIWIGLAMYVLLTINEFYPIFKGVKPLDYLFGDTIWAIHFVIGSILLYALYTLFFTYKNQDNAK